MPSAEPVQVRDATSADWPAVWSFMEGIVRAGETYVWPLDSSEAECRQRWFHDPPGRTVVVVDTDGQVIATAEMHPNHDGPGSHIANAGFMVAPEASGRGIGRLLGRAVLDLARQDGYRGMQFNAVVETNVHGVALWRSLGFDIMATIPHAFAHPTEGYVGIHVMYRRL